MNAHSSLSSCRSSLLIHFSPRCFLHHDDQETAGGIIMSRRWIASAKKENTKQPECRMCTQTVIMIIWTWMLLLWLERETCTQFPHHYKGKGSGIRRLSINIICCKERGYWARLICNFQDSWKIAEITLTAGSKYCQQPSAICWRELVSSRNRQILSFWFWLLYHSRHHHSQYQCYSDEICVFLWVRRGRAH